jgi:hypothetical protein
MTDRARTSIPWWIAACLFCTLACEAATDPLTPDEEPTADPVTYQFGVKFEPPAGRVVHGIGQWVEYDAKYVALLPPDKHPASELIFLDLGDTPRGWRPQLLAEQIQSLDEQGMIPHIDLALRGLQPGKAELAAMTDKLYGIDDDIAASSQYDSRINDVIAVVRAYGRPVMVRIGGEFSGSWNGYHPFEYPKAFRKIVGMFRAGGADNAAFIWCYEPAAPGDFADRNATGDYRWFPGADVIDWFSVDVFNSHDFSGPLTQAGRDDGSAYARTLAFLDMAVANGRPVVIAESSPSQYDFASEADAQAAWTEWFEPYFELIATRPEIKWFHFISYDWSQASYYAESGWKNNDLAASSYLVARYVAEISKAKYLHADEKALLKDSGY